MVEKPSLSIQLTDIINKDISFSYTSIYEQKTMPNEAFHKFYIDFMSVCPSYLKDLTIIYSVWLLREYGIEYFVRNQGLIIHDEELAVLYKLQYGGD